MTFRILHLVALSFLCLFSVALPQPTTTVEFLRQGNTFLCGNVRFEVLSPTLVRMEYSPAGQFLDTPTFLALKRDWPEFKITVSEKNGWLIVETGKLELRYRLKSGKLSPENLLVSWSDGKSEQTWKPGDKDDKNLGAPGRSLDGIGRVRPMRLTDGILSRNGYFLMDDSQTPVWDKPNDWITPRTDKENQDWYLFTYGHDYQHVLKEFSDLCGKIPMVPRYSLGLWITDLNYEYLPGTPYVDKYHYTDEDVKNLVLRTRKEGIPVDVLVLDFAWHKYGWQGGYDWSPIFPHPKEFLKWAHGEGLKVTVNDHPGYNKETTLSDSDSHTAEVRKELNIPASPRTTYAIDIVKGWKFRTDPGDAGMTEKWFSRGFNDTSWETLNAGKPWEDQGHAEYDGFAWYRKWVVVPKALKDTARMLVFSGVDDAYDLFVNGVKAAHFGAQGSSVWNQPTWTDVTPYLLYDQPNLIVLRVNDWGGDGGIVGSTAAFADRPPAVHGVRFNLADKHQAEVFMKDLHDPVLDDGVDFWWVDGWGSYDMDGITNQLWTNRLFYDYTERHTGKRGFMFSRHGGLGNHRYPSFFTGDTHSEWGVLADEVPATAIGGNVLVAYTTHDIGGFLGKKIDYALYARWLEFGVFSPILRLHCAHENPEEGNLRMPWIYGGEATSLVRDYVKLRYRLIPYLYTYAHVAHESGLPIVRPLYVEFPELEKAYSCPGEYLFGDEMLVAPMTDSTGSREIYFPPGEWIDYFTREVYKGNQSVSYDCPLDRIPLFVRSGSIIPMASDMLSSNEKPLDHLVVDVYGPRAAEFSLYEDDGESLAYLDGESAETRLLFSGVRGRSCEMTIGTTVGSYNGQPKARSYEVRLHGVAKPSVVAVNGRSLRPARGGGEGWTWDRQHSTATIMIGPRTIKQPLKVTIK